MPIAVGDAAWLRAWKRLNAMLADQAAAAGARFVDTYASSVGHDVRRLPGSKWVEGFVPTAPASAVHPDALGMANRRGAGAGGRRAISAVISSS